MTESPLFAAGEIPQWTLGDRLRKARLHAGLEQTELAKEIGIGRTSIVKYEKDVQVPPRPVILSWALRCGVPFEWLSNGHVPAGHGGPGPGVSSPRNNKCNSAKFPGNREITNRQTIFPSHLTIRRAA